METSEALAASIIEACGLPHEVPNDVPGAQDYFDHILPQLALEAISSEPAKLEHLLGKFDALVVDEFQDHDTCLATPPTESAPSEATHGDTGWWSLYTSMLRDGWNAPMAIFGDQAQRPPFRPKGRFQLQHLRQRLPQHAHVQLDQVVRYTRPLHEFLLSLEAEGTESLVAGLPRFCPLVDGIEVALHNTELDKVPLTLESILEDWKSQGICTPSKVLILYDRSHIDKTPLAGTSTLFDHRLTAFADSLENPGPGLLSHSSIHKAKGLDALAVILLVPKSFEQLQSAYDRFTYFMGASRARQVLAVVHYANGVGSTSRHRMG